MSESIISPSVPQLQPPFMVLLLLIPQLPQSSKFFVMPMISTTTLQPPTNGLSTVMLVHTSIVVEIMVLIIVRNPVTKPALHRTRLSFKRREIVNQVMVAVMEDILLVAAIIKAVETMKGTNLECQTLPMLLRMECIASDGVWMVYYDKCNTWSGTPHAHTTIFYDLPFWLGPATISQAPIHSIIIVPPPVIAFKVQLLFWILQLQFKGEVLPNNDLIQVSKSKATQIFCTFQTSFPDEYIEAQAGALGEALGLNL